MHSVPESGFTVSCMTASTPNLLAEDDWISAACTLPTSEQPLRRRDFDHLFAHDVRAVTRVTATRTRLDLRPAPDVAGRAAALAVEEAGCCSFFCFELTVADGVVSLSVETAPAHHDVLQAITARAESLLGADPGAGA